jgi:hypothetical protein
LWAETTLLYAVLNVLGCGAAPQMSGIATSWIVARMADIQFIAPVAIGQGERHSMRFHGAGFPPDHAVSLAQHAQPWPATVRL